MTFFSHVFTKQRNAQAVYNSHPADNADSLFAFKGYSDLGHLLSLLSNYAAIVERIPADMTLAS